MVSKPDSKVTVARRALLTTGVVALAAVGVYAVFGADSEPPEPSTPRRSKSSKKTANSKADALRKNFSYLKLNEVDVEKYVAEYEAHFRRETKKKPNAKFFTTFLLSTDFFLNGAKPDMPVTYVGLHDPLKFPCQNPFARFD